MDPNIKPKTLKILKENKRENLGDLGEVKILQISHTM